MMRRGTSNYTRFLLVALALSAFIACSSVKYLGKYRMSAPPLLRYQFFSQENRALSKLDDHLWPYNGEEPIGAGHSSTMLLGIFSTTGDKYNARREYIRETYLATGDDRICKLEEFKRQATQKLNDRRCKIPYTFVIGGGASDRPKDHDDNEPLTLETDQDGHADEEGDCTYLNVQENMEDGKSTTYMKFGAGLHVEYGIDYVAKIDDDTVLAIQLLLQFIEDDLPPTPFNRRIYGGTGWASYAHNHIYAAGQFYFMSSDLADYVSNQLTTEDRLEMMHGRHTEDADMGTFIFSHPRPIKFMNLSSFRFWHHPKKSKTEFLAGWKSIDSLPGHGNLLPFWHLCPSWMSGRGI